jgi:hypothetical protein
MNQNEIHEEINSKLNMGNDCQLSDQNFFSPVCYTETYVLIYINL